MFHFFFPFYGDIIRVVYAMLAIVIEDLEMRLGNSNLPLEKNAIWLEPLAQKKQTSKQTAGVLYYQY